MNQSIRTEDWQTNGDADRSGEYTAPGAHELLRAFRYPLKFKKTLFIGGSVVALLSVGGSLFAFGGVFMTIAAVFCFLLGKAFSFSSISHTVNRFSHGDLDPGLLPEVGPAFLTKYAAQQLLLSIGAYAISFGPFLFFLMIALYSVTSSIDAHNQAVISDLEKIPGTSYYAGREIAGQTSEVRKVLNRTANAKAAEVDVMNEAATGKGSQSVGSTESKTTNTPTSTTSPPPIETKATGVKAQDIVQRKPEQLLSGILSLAAPVFVIGVITFLWGAFFFPAASSVAGVTRSVRETLNPAAGLDMIRKIGFDYGIILLMFAVIVIVYIAGRAILSFALAPFDLTIAGGLLALAIASFLEFYLFAVFAYVLGISIHKATGRRKIPA